MWKREVIGNKGDLRSSQLSIADENGLSHRGIGKLPPLRYYLDKFVTPQKSNMLWTLTLCARTLLLDGGQVITLGPTGLVLE